MASCEPSSRIVGISFSQAVSLTFSASSIQASRMRAFDLRLSRLWRRPANANETRRSAVRMYFSPMSKSCASHGKPWMACLISSRLLSSRLLRCSRPARMTPLRPFSACDFALIAAQIAAALVLPDPRPPFRTWKRAGEAKFWAMGRGISIFCVVNANAVEDDGGWPHAAVAAG